MGWRTIPFITRHAKSLDFEWSGFTILIVTQLNLFNVIRKQQLNKLNWSKIGKLEEASSLDLIKMTKFWLDFDQKILTMTNVNVRTWPKDYTDEH